MTFTNPNDRIAGYCQAVLHQSRVTTKSGGDDEITLAQVLKGVQSVGVSRTVDRESIPDVGRFQREYGSYAKHTYTITLSRVLSKGEDFFYNTTGESSYENSHILSVATNKTIGFTGINDRLKNYDIVLVYGPDAYSYVGAGSLQTIPNNQIETTTYRCCLLTNISYTIPVNGPIIEDLTFITHAYTQNDEVDVTNLSLDFEHSNEQTLRRQDIDISNCLFPLEVEKAFDTGNTLNGTPILGLQQIEISAEINYTDLADIGVWRGSINNLAEMNLYKQVELPIGVSCTYSGVVRSQYFTDSTQDHLVTDTYHTAGTYGAENKTINNYKTDRAIKIVALADATPTYFQWDLGKKNYISSFEVTGGDATGGNVEASMSFQNDHSEIFLLKGNSVVDFVSDSIL